MARPLARRLDGSRRIRLDDVDPTDTEGIEKEEGLKRIETLGRELSELENLLTYAGTHALLVVRRAATPAARTARSGRSEFSNISELRPAARFRRRKNGARFLWRVHKAIRAADT
jgi:hypothetical protein